MGLNDTPRADRLHIAIYGRRNAGKSSLINSLTGQDIALVSDEPGTTTDPVYKSMEMHPVGPVVFIDTAGFDDEGKLGKLRVQRTEDVTDRSDIGIIVIDGNELAKHVSAYNTVHEDNEAKLLDHERQWAKLLEDRKTPLIFAVNKWELVEKRVFSERVFELVKKAAGDHPVVKISAAEKTGLAELRDLIRQAEPEDFLRKMILGDMIREGGLALLVMPQDIQAPKGRLILPQVQTIRELLDRKCTTVATTADGFERAVASLKIPPDLIITDSQCFGQIYEKKPAESGLTSFSVLFAAYKGDIDVFVKGASRLDDMTEKSRVLIAEACTHVPLSEDIGRVKIPDLLRKKFGKGIKIVNVCGNDFPDTEALKDFDLVIHCGACMFNRKHVLSRIAAAEAAGVPVTNYGVILAKLGGILDKIRIPDGKNH